MKFNSEIKVMTSINRQYIDALNYKDNAEHTLYLVGTPFSTNSNLIYKGSEAFITYKFDKEGTYKFSTVSTILDCVSDSNIIEVQSSAINPAVGVCTLPQGKNFRIKSTYCKMFNTPRFYCDTKYCFINIFDSIVTNNSVAFYFSPTSYGQTTTGAFSVNSSKPHDQLSSHECAIFLNGQRCMAKNSDAKVRITGFYSQPNTMMYELTICDLQYLESGITYTFEAAFQIKP